jgi:hypothetical protein
MAVLRWELPGRKCMMQKHVSLVLHVVAVISEYGIDQFSELDAAGLVNTTSTTFVDLSETMRPKLRL